MDCLLPSLIRVFALAHIHSIKYFIYKKKFNHMQLFDLVSKILINFIESK